MDFPTVRELSKQKNAVRILKFLMKNKEEQNFTDIYISLDMNDCTCLYWLKRLESFGIIESVRSRTNLHSKYYHVSDKENVEGVTERYKWNVGFKLARLIPYTRTGESQTREDKRFIALCEQHFLTIDEGISAIKKCPKIGLEKVGHPHNRAYLFRKEQGYDEPEKGEISEQRRMEEAMKAIE